VEYSHSDYSPNVYQVIQVQSTMSVVVKLPNTVYLLVEPIKYCMSLVVKVQSTVFLVVTLQSTMSLVGKLPSTAYLMFFRVACFLIFFHNLAKNGNIISY